MPRYPAPSTPARSFLFFIFHSQVLPWCSLEATNVETTLSMMLGLPLNYLVLARRALLVLDVPRLHNAYASSTARHIKAILASLIEAERPRRLLVNISGVFMTLTQQIFIAILVSLFVSPTMAVELTYKEYTKAPEVWKRGFVFGISRYMTAVAQPDEEPPYPVRSAFQRCLGNSSDSVLVQQVEGYIKAHPANANGPMIAVVVRALFELCRAEISKIRAPTPVPGGR